ncbi:hypothetical protein SAMN05443550_1219 [Pedobacter hartonius]|uniref:Uncharacterized protein n=1 Tax=Pedobacter hartonius TaxID=425514 RepID=A0A1H4HIL1_9SPHI|nr:hypothetical protein SAMN05443550_1219 [Pedobacter hartonius]
MQDIVVRPKYTYNNYLPAFSSCCPFAFKGGLRKAKLMRRSDQIKRVEVTEMVHFYIERRCIKNGMKITKS